MTSNGLALEEYRAAYVRSSLSWYSGVLGNPSCFLCSSIHRLAGPLSRPRLLSLARPRTIRLRLSDRKSPLEDKNTSEASASMWIHAGQAFLLTRHFKLTERMNCATAAGSDPTKPHELRIEPRTTCTGFSNEIRDDSVAYVPSA